MQILDLSRNLISELLTESLRGLIKIEYRNLAHNQLSSLNYLLWGLNKLSELNLSDNVLDFLYFNEFKYLESLHTLDLSNNIRLKLIGPVNNLLLLVEEMINVLILRNSSHELIKSINFNNGNFDKLVEVDFSYLNLSQNLSLFNE